MVVRVFWVFFHHIHLQKNQKGMLWDDAEEKCLAADGSECPDVGTCEPQVHGNEEGAGGLPVECHGFELGNVCAAPGCLKGCVPTADKGELFDRCASNWDG